MAGRARRLPDPCLCAWVRLLARRRSIHSNRRPLAGFVGVNASRPVFSLFVALSGGLAIERGTRIRRRFRIGRQSSSIGDEIDQLVAGQIFAVISRRNLRSGSRVASSDKEVAPDKVNAIDFHRFDRCVHIEIRSRPVPGAHRSANRPVPEAELGQPKSSRSGE